VRLHKVTVDTIRLQYSHNEFPLAFSYLEPEYNGTYESDKYQWYEVARESDELHSGETPVIALVCLDQEFNHILPNSLHISVIEVRAEDQHKGYGTRVMKMLIQLATGLVQVVTLQTRERSLVKFYKKLGFRESFTPDRLKYMRLYVN
jgi:ribosomal protein S18 acetylase RimI-like enzyme